MWLSQKIAISQSCIKTSWIDIENKAQNANDIWRIYINVSLKED